ncbi:MAG: hypothetical protein GEU68_12690 [Actinobacteria bacterium]|nr:hypothetical protein [Actinomycetota bacterium]
MSDKLEKDLKDMFDEIPEAEGRRDRAMFVAGVAARRPQPIWRRALVPAAAMFVVLFALSIGSLEASPGQTLYPLRNALSSVGIAQEPVEVVDRAIRRAEVSLERAEELLDDNEDFAGAEARTERTLAQLGEARALLRELSGEAREERADEIEDLNQDAFRLLEDIDEERAEAAEEAREESDDDDDDSSGPGSGSDDDDNSGPGSGGSDDSGSDDSSGSGSGSSGSGSDDSSGRGSASDD